MLSKCSLITRLQVPFAGQETKAQVSQCLVPGPRYTMATMDLLAVQWGSTPALGLLHHGGLVAQGDSNT